ncbi:hypothetical protein H9623_03790 [Oerskovia sp. Sa1BUA8]|uniref:Lipoprotein n=2 Tax=Oerskovia TaxID=162491 RepID=A0A9D5YYX2_9CELL|nr:MULTISPECIES: hypothetical protein [Oerskovia]MBD7979904.1 hypothetical protein [Oerskovia merdavium]MBE7699429.1 hypothetical protein [Oerskovia douganii]
MTRTRGPLVAALFSLTLLVLAGCTGAGAGAEPSPGGGTEGTTASSPAADGDQEQAAGEASITTASLAEQTFDATAGSGEAPGGTITMTLRSVEVTGRTMTVRWALRWDNPDKGAGERASFSDLGARHVPTVTDSTNLKIYKPFCTKGAWKGAALDVQACELSALVSPSASSGAGLTNGSTIEAWALLPSPQGDPGPLDILVSDGWPAFSGITPVVVDDGK